MFVYLIFRKSFRSVGNATVMERASAFKSTLHNCRVSAFGLCILLLQLVISKNFYRLEPRRRAAEEAFGDPGEAFGGIGDVEMVEIVAQRTLSGNDDRAGKVACDQALLHLLRRSLAGI